MLEAEAEAQVRAASDARLAALQAELDARYAAERAERERKRAEENARETALLAAHMCARCGYDEPEVPLCRRMRARWEGRCAHGVWEPQLDPARPIDLDRCHLVSSRCGMLELKQYSRLRCRRCALEVPNFLRPQPPEPQPLVPPSAQLVMGAVHVAPLLDVCYPEWPRFTNSAGVSRPNMGAAAPSAEVRVRLGVFVVP